MKYMLVILCFFLCYSCSQPKYSVCIPTVHPDSFKTTMIPISIGNFWVYEDNYFSRGKNDVIKTEIISLDTVSLNINGIKSRTLAYKLEMESSMTNTIRAIFYYIKCESKILLCYAEQSDPKNVTTFLNEIYENPTLNLVDSLNHNENWIGTEKINTKFGDLNCYIIEQNTGYDVSGSLGKINVYKIKSYFCKGIGLVRVDNLNSQGKLITQRNLINYEIQK